MKLRAALLALAAAACTAPATSAPPANIGADHEPLRESFDAAHGRVRAILLAAPT